MLHEEIFTPPLSPGTRGCLGELHHALPARIPGSGARDRCSPPPSSISCPLWTLKRFTATTTTSATACSPTLRCTAAQPQRSLPTKWHRSQKLIMTDPVLPGSGRLANSLSSSSTASFTGPRSGQGGGPRGWLAEDRGLARRREPPTGPGVDYPGEDAVAHAVRDRGPRQRGSSPSTSLTSTSRTGGPGCAPKRRDPGCSGRPVQPQLLPRLLAGRGAGPGERRRSQLRPNRERW